MTKKLPIAAFLAAFYALSSLAAQTSDPAEAAMAEFRNGSFEKAFAIISDSVPETSKDTILKRRVAEALATIGVEEYDFKNYKNAYEAFKKALKYDPSNAKATQYFLKMRKESNVAELKNEGGPRVKPSATKTDGASGANGESAKADEGAAARVAEEKAAAERMAAEKAAAERAAAANRAELEAARKDLEDAKARMDAMQSSMQGRDRENDELRAQVERQLKIIESYMAAQNDSRNAPRAQPAASAAASAEERELLARMMELLVKLSDRASEPPEAVPQGPKDWLSDPAAVTALVAAGCFVLAFITVTTLLAISVVRNRRDAARAAYPRYDTARRQLSSSNRPSRALPDGGREDSPALEFVEANGQGTRLPVELDMRKDLLSAERLQRLYDDARNGGLGWDAIRRYLDELGLALKIEILKAAERKIDQGDLLTPQAALPVLLPFLADRDDYVRGKAETLASDAYAPVPRERMADGPESIKAADPLSLDALLKIPERLKAIFKDGERSLMTARVARGIGSELGLSKNDCDLLFKAGLAHDCGYLMLDRDRLQRIFADSKSSKKDRDYVKTHASKGPDFFSGIALPDAFRDGLVHHHELNDGSGYPDGLKGGDIPLFGRIIGVADAYASRSGPREEESRVALRIIAEKAPAHFDRDIVDALARAVPAQGERR